MAVLREVKQQKPYYAVLRDLKTGKLVGMEECDYRLVQKGNEFNEFTRSLNINKPYYEYTVVSDAKTGKVKQLTERNGALNDTLVIMEDKNGNIVSKTTSSNERILAELHSKNDVDAVNNVLAYNRLNGLDSLL